MSAVTSPRPVSGFVKNMRMFWLFAVLAAVLGFSTPIYNGTWVLSLVFIVVAAYFALTASVAKQNQRQTL